MSAAAAINFPIARGAVRRLAVLFVGCAVALAAFVWLVIPSTHSTALISKAPAFSLPSVSGNQTVSLGGTNGKPAVVNFFAAWCVPCRTELPRFAAASATNKNVTFLGVDDQDSRSQARDLLAASGIHYATGYDPQGSVAPKYGITTGLPATVFIDRTGHITHTQFGEISASELNNQLRLLDKQQ